MSRKAVEAKSARGRLTTIEQPGLMIGRAVRGRTDLYLGWRETAVVEMGPGSGKTTGIAVPMVLDAPGVVVCTSNKRDLADGIRGACEARGTFWCFDPQDIAHYGPPDWWWNPLRGITDPVEALRLAQIICDTSSPADASKDAYFDSAGPQLEADLILAAAVDGRQIDQVYLWVSDPGTKRTPEPVRILEDHGYALSAASLRRPYAAADDERSGIFGTAAKSLSFLTSPSILRWVTDDGGRREFVPGEFVRSGRDTLVSLSREGVGSAGPLTAALTVAVTTAAERFATEHPAGRLPVPLVAVLDEVANVCRWRELPSMFSHYGSAGITLFAILQNWSQAVNAWKAAGAQQMWDAANIRMVGAGIADRRHLEDLAALIGERHVERRSVSTTRPSRHGGGPSVTSSWDREQIMSVDELASLPPGRMVVVPAGGYPILARTVPWWERPEMAEVVAASIDWYEPGGPGEADRLRDAALTVSDPIEHAHTRKAAP
jgi:type IV secretory pathway TraG/TraD family ATPase VirD4